MDRLKFNLEHTFLKIEDGIESLVNDYWLLNDKDKWKFTYKSLISNYPKFGNTRNAIEKRMKADVVTKFIETCVVCGKPNVFIIHVRQDLIRLSSFFKTRFKCKNCTLINERSLREEFDKKMGDFKRLKGESIRNLADTFLEALSGLSENEVKFIKIVNSHQDFESQDLIYREALRVGLLNNESFWIMRRRLVNLKIIELVKSTNEKKPYVFVHPDTVNKIRFVKPYSLQILLSLYNKSKESHPDYSGRFRVSEDHLLRIGETFIISLNITYKNIDLILFDRQSHPEMISSIIKKVDRNPSGRTRNFLTNFFNTDIPMDLTIADYPLYRKYSIFVDSPTEFTKGTNLRIGIWKHLNYIRLKIEPEYLPFSHGITRPV